MIVQIRRKEYKYCIPVHELEPLRDRFLMHMVHDPFCDGKPDKCYSIRSIYFDTTHLRFYHEKAEGLKIRKKLRVRAYDERGENSAAFLEIKRKFGDEILKERARVPLEQAPNLLNGARINLMGNENNSREKSSLDNFIYLVKSLNLIPTLLVTYEREALFGKENPGFRVTFDHKIRSFPNPGIDELFREQDLKTYVDPFSVVEIKFSGQMPVWVREILRDYKLRQQSVSKYCLGLDAWKPERHRLASE
jgi:SPX domain protein involved in polyphosphate accumulation